MSAVLVRYARGGGRAPADDELLELDADGAYSARRSVGGARIGSFAGRIPPGTLAAVVADAAACRAAGAFWLATPRDGATELIELGGEGEVTAEMDANASPDGPWGRLAGRLRGLVDEATAGPVAGLELIADAGRARLVAVGSEPLEVDPSSVAVRVVHLDGTGGLRGQWQGASVPGEGWTPAAPGWTLDLPFAHGLTAAPGEWLQVWVTLRVRDGAPRAARLFLAVPGGR
ncbi:MAG TPA: hypothetical protein VES19_12330 [Candidatus Limnocylindrales bacterium]|nr:hypothetical protein [Candidatus Limnocylindrales bacterium]